MKKIRWGVLSTAKIAQTQLIPAIMSSRNAEVAGIASKNSEAAKQIAAAFRIPKVYESYEALLQDPDIDAVYIPLPNHLHKEWTLQAARHGKHVLCEKPAALTAEEATDMVTYCQEKNVKFMEAFMYQFHPQHERVREIISTGEIGEIKLMKSSFSFYLEERRANIRMDKTMGGGSLYDVGSYTLHAIRQILQAEPAEVFAQADIDSATGVDLSARGFLKLNNGVNAIFDCSLDMVRRNEYEIIGTKGTIKATYGFRPDMLNGGVGVIVVHKGDVTREEKIKSGANPYVLEVEHFSDAILQHEQPLQTGHSTIQNMRVIDACFESIKTGKTVKLN